MRSPYWSIVPAITLAAGAADTGSIGRLFFTPDFRDTLERARWSAGSEHTASMHLNGVVVDSRGAATLWIDHRIWRDQRDAVEPSAPERATVRNGEGSPKSLRVGESADPVTAKRSDGISGGRIVVHKR